MQGLGQLAAALVTLIVVVIYKDHLISVASVAECHGQCAMTVDKMWRFVIAFGGIPGWFALYYRLTIPETPRYTFDVLYDVEKASVDARKYRYGKQGNVVNPVTQAQSRREMAKYRTPRPTLLEVLRFYSQKRQAIRLFGTSMSWLYVFSPPTPPNNHITNSFTASSTSLSTASASPPPPSSPQWASTNAPTSTNTSATPPRAKSCSSAPAPYRATG